MALSSTIARGVQAFCAILVLSLSSALVAQQVYGGAPARVNFTVFTSVFAILSLFYLFASLFMSTIGHPLIEAGVQALNALFFLSAGIAVASQLGVHSCRNRVYLLTNGITNGGGFHNMEGRCREAQAMTFFLWLGFAAFAGGAILDFIRSSTKVSKSARPGSEVRGMSQV